VSYSTYHNSFTAITAITAINLPADDN